MQRQWKLVALGFLIQVRHLVRLSQTLGWTITTPLALLGIAGETATDIGTIDADYNSYHILDLDQSVEVFKQEDWMLGDKWVVMVAHSGASDYTVYHRRKYVSRL